MYKIAFIGGSIDSIAGYPHFIASQMDKKFEVIAAAFTHNPQKNKETALQWKVPKTYENYKDLIKYEKENIDAVVILTPTPLHVQMITELLNSCIPVICEKPLVSSTAEIQQINNIYDSSKHFLVVTNNYSAYPMVRELRHQIQKGELGDILAIRLKMPQESFLRPPKSVKYPQKWRLKDDFIPMISLDLGAHLHHLAHFLLSEEPTEVMAHYSSFSKYNVIDDVNIFLKYKSGIEGNFWLSKVALGNRNGLSLEVYGSNASAIWVQENPEKLEISYSTGDKVIKDRGSDMLGFVNPLYNRMTPGHPAGFIEAFANLYSDISDALDAFHQQKIYLNSYVYGLEHAAKSINFLHSASLSNDTKSWVKIRET
ncbi:Gfo/Idh/MocA family oxidoreductase [Sulfurimonas sp. SAG-AH-194-C21]|nr:Gfo/Idh/MocA family oxidoreductase [Sulfurimonas sp. SAG-AH-194-C21]MDF1884392.1 Gfo/Idh/MocA family oxidoreductase [Sulfurimonas sp. SAG-AH-194-C21]